MSWRSSCIALASVVVILNPLAAQEDDQSATFHLSDVSFQEEDPDGTLPPVEVRPPDEPGPEGDVTTTTGLSDTSLTFPSLSDQIIGDLDGGTRGAPMSIFDNPRAIDVVTRQLLNERSPQDIGQALEQTPGVLIQRTGRGQSSPFVRGLTGQQVLILVDGIRMTNATFRAGPNQYFNTIDPNMVERIEVIRGPGSVLYGGDAIGGVINVVTKKATNTGYNFLTAGTVQRFSSADLGYTGRVDVEGSVGSTGIFAGGGYGNYNNLDLGGPPDCPPGFDVGRQPATSWRYNSADIKMNYLIGDCAEFVFGFQHYVGEDVFRSDRFPQNRETIFDPQQRNLTFVRLQGYSDSSLISTYQITGSLHRTKEGRIDSRPIGTFDAAREFTDEQTGVNAVFTSDLGYAGILSYGVDWYHDEIDASIYNPDGDGDSVQFPNDSYYSRYGFFLQWDVPLTDRLLATSGVRYEHVTAGATVTAGGVADHVDPEYQDWIGHVGLTYELSPCMHLVGSISEGFRAPNLDDLAAVNDNVFVGTQLPNPNLQPETSITYEVGAKVDGDLFRGQVFTWWTDLQDYIVRGAPNMMLLLERTNGEAYLNGVELSGEYLLRDDRSLYGNFWYTYGQNTVADEPLSRIPPMQGIIGLRQRWNGGNDWFDFYAWLVDKQDRLSARDISDVRRIPSGGTPGYATFNLRYGRMITERQRLSLNLENIFDKQYRVHGSGSAGPGINAVLTYELLH